MQDSDEPAPELLIERIVEVKMILDRLQELGRNPPVAGERPSGCDPHHEEGDDRQREQRRYAAHCAAKGVTPHRQPGLARERGAVSSTPRSSLAVTAAAT